MLAVFAEQIVERLAHEGLEAGALFHGQQMKCPAHLGAEVGADDLLAGARTCLATPIALGS